MLLGGKDGDGWTLKKTTLTSVPRGYIDRKTCRGSKLLNVRVDWWTKDLSHRPEMLKLGTLGLKPVICNARIDSLNGLKKKPGFAPFDLLLEGSYCCGCRGDPQLYHAYSKLLVHKNRYRSLTFDLPHTKEVFWQI